MESKLEDEATEATGNALAPRVSVIHRDDDHSRDDDNSDTSRAASLHKVTTAGVDPATFKPSPRLYIAFGTLALITLMVALDGTSLIVALPVSCFMLSCMIEMLIGSLYYSTEAQRNSNRSFLVWHFILPYIHNLPTESRLLFPQFRSQTYGHGGSRNFPHRCPGRCFIGQLCSATRWEILPGSRRRWADCTDGDPGQGSGAAVVARTVVWDH